MCVFQFGDYGNASMQLYNEMKCYAAFFDELVAYIDCCT